MSFLQPLGLLGLIAVPIIIIIYLIKSRYVQRPVSSTFIWKRSLKYIKRKIPMSVILSLLLIIQILTVITASLAIARPTIPLTSEETILILDASASMKTTDGGEETRFDRAVNKVYEYAESASTTNVMSLIIANNEPYAIANTKVTDKGEEISRRFDSPVDFKLAIGNLTCTDYEMNIDAALEIAQDIQKENPDAKIKIITDKDYLTTNNVEIINIAKNTEKNIVVTNLTDTLLPSKSYEYIATLTSYGFATIDPETDREIYTGMECTIMLYVDDGSYDASLNGAERDEEAYKKHCYVGVKNVAVPNSLNSEFPEVQVIFTPNKNRVSNSDGQVIASIDKQITNYKHAWVEIVANDALESDNTAYVSKTETVKPKIMLVSRFLDGNKDGKVDQNASTTLLAALVANGYTVRYEDMFVNVTEEMIFSGYDLYIFEGVDLPAKEVFPTDGAVWALNPLSVPTDFGININDVTNYTDPDNAGFAMFKATESQDEELLSAAFKTITSKVSKKASLGQYTQMTVSGGKFETIFLCDESANMPALLAGSYVTSDGPVRAIVTSFDLRYSNWAYLVTDYTILIGNLVKYSMPDALEQTRFTIGDKVQFNAPAGTSKITLKHGNTTISTFEDGNIDISFVLNRVGVYEVVVEFANEGGEQKETISYKLPTYIAEEESDIAKTGFDVSVPEVIKTRDTEKPKIEIFPYLIALLLLLLVVEWGVYHRDGF